MDTEAVPEHPPADSEAPGASDGVSDVLTLAVAPRAVKQGGAFRRSKGNESGLARSHNSSGGSFSSAGEKTGPSAHTYFGPTLQRP